MSGTDFSDGKRIRKGAVDTIMKYIEHQGGEVPAGLKDTCDEVAKKGGTPLVVTEGNRILGTIYLKDTVKP